MNRIIAITTFLCLTSTLLAQGENILIQRSYWKGDPSLDQVKEAVSSGNDPSAFNSHKFDAVTWAIIEEASNDLVWFLLNQEGNDVNKRSHDGRTPIFWAAYRGNTSLMLQLIEKGAKTDLIDDHGYSLVNFAATTGQTDQELYQLCIDNGAELSKEQTSYGATPLLLLMPFLDSKHLIRYFEEHGLSMKDTDKEGNNAFVYAAKTGNEAMMSYALNCKLDPRANNDAAMIFASKGTRNKKNDLATFQRLVTLGVSTSAKDKDNRDAMFYLSSRCKDRSVLEYFFDQGLTLEAKDTKGNCAILSAVSYSDPETLNYLLGKLSTSSISNSKGENMLHLAVNRGNLEIVNTVLSSGLDINAKTKDGLTALHLAAMTSKNDDLLKLLISQGADRSILTSFEESGYELARENELLQAAGISLDFLKQ